MISVRYLIVCFELIYSLNQAVSFSPSNSEESLTYDQKSLLNLINVENQDDVLAHIMAPYANRTYEDQLEKKQNRCIETVNIILSHYKKMMKPITCKIQEIVPLTVIKAYRNKDEFHIWHSFENIPKTVGILLKKSVMGKPIVFHPTKVATIRESHKRVAQVYEDFIRSSHIPACYIINGGGYWRTLLVRSNGAGDVMARITVQPKGYSSEEIQEHKEALKDYFIKHLPNLTLFHQECRLERCTNIKGPNKLLYGKPYLLENLKGFNFQILPDTFFPINSAGAEALVDTIVRTAKLKPNSIVLDICSGTGSNSIMLSKYVGNVIGFEYIKFAHAEAEKSAHINKIPNIKFQLGKLLVTLKSEMKYLKNTTADIVAIVNSGDTRPGVAVIRAMRRFPLIYKIMYITGKPDSKSALENFDNLCLSTLSNFPAFTLTKVIPVDTLPQTTYTELIIMFERPKLDHM